MVIEVGAHLRHMLSHQLAQEWLISRGHVADAVGQAEPADVFVWLKEMHKRSGPRSWLTCPQHEACVRHEFVYVAIKVQLYAHFLLGCARVQNTRARVQNTRWFDVLRCSHDSKGAVSYSVTRLLSVA